MANLIAYMAVLSNRHVEWFKRHPDSTLYLIAGTLAQELIPRLARDMSALPTWILAKLLRELSSPPSVRKVVVLDMDSVEELDLSAEYILADEDVSHELVRKYLPVDSSQLTFEMIWARWDMNAVKRAQPVIEDVGFTTDHKESMDIAVTAAEKSPDWWRQVGAALFVRGTSAASACNDHYPTEYETDMKGDPRILVDAGEAGHYLSLHAERGVIASCAKQGISTKGALLYVTTFPCEDCAREIVAAGIDHVFFKEGYSALNAQEVFKTYGVKITQVKDPTPA